MVAVACAGLVLIFAAGCASAPTPGPGTATSTPTPVFASDEEALAAATEAYANYQELADEIDSDGGQNPERIASVVSERFLPTAVHQSDGFLQSNLRSIGTTKFIIDGTQHLSYSDPATTDLSLYICDDVSGVDVVDEAGASRVAEARDVVTPFEVSFVLNPDGVLVVDSRDVWVGDDFC